MRYRFGDFVLCPERYELTCSGRPVKLEPRVLEVLAYLLANHGRVVPKAELLDRLWAGVVVTESALTRTIREARRVLDGDGSSRRSLIRTVYGRGFQFSGRVTVAAGSGAPIDETPPAPIRPRPLPSVAVLPFADLSTAGDQGHFCDGLAEELIVALTRIEGLFVASRTSSFQFRGPGCDVRVIGERINVSTVLEGSVRKDGGRLRITARLVNVADDGHLWSAVFERAAREVFAIQAEIAESIARTLSVVLSDRERLAWRNLPRADVGAYDWYLRGRQVSAQASGKNLEGGRQMFLRAIELDPDYLPALCGLADCCSWLYLCWGGSERELATAEETSRRALALAPDFAEAHTSRALVLFLDNRLDDANAAFETAIRLNPRLFKTHYAYARLHWLSARLVAAAHHLEQSERLNPGYHALPALLAKVYGRLGRAGDAEAARRRCVDRAEEALTLDSRNVRALYLGASALAGLGELERATEWAERACATDPDDQVAREYAAAVYARAGRPAPALAYLEQAIDAGYRHFEWIVCEPDFEPLRTEPRYQALLRRWCGPEPVGPDGRAVRGLAAGAAGSPMRS